MSLKQSLIFTLLKSYYHITAYIPRPLPHSEEEFLALKSLLMKYYNVEDNIMVWHTLSGQISSVPITKVRKPYAHYVNAARRLTINRLAQDQKLLAIDKENARLKEEYEKTHKTTLQDEAPRVSTELQALPGLESSVVPISESSGLRGSGEERQPQDNSILPSHQAGSSDHHAIPSEERLLPLGGEKS